jgi:hypothetical protein
MTVRSRLLVFVVLGCASLAPLARAQAAESSSVAPAKSPADLDYEAAWANYRVEPPAGVEHPSKEYFKWADKKYEQFAVAVRAFGEKHPTDPRRYEGWVQASYTGPSFIVDFKPEFAEKPTWSNLISDSAAVLAYRSEQVRLLQQVVEADDATPRQRAGAFNALLTDAGTVARLKGEKFEVTSFRPLVERLVAKFPDERVVPIIEMYTGRLRYGSPALAAEFEASLAGNPVISAAIAKVAALRDAAAAKEAEAAKVRAAGVG